MGTSQKPSAKGSEGPHVLSTPGAHPYRTSLVEAGHNLGAALGPNVRRDDASARIREFRRAVDEGAADGLSREELAQLIEVVASCRDELRRRWVPIEKNADWIGGSLGTVGAITLLLQLSYGRVMVIFAVLAVIVSRLMATSAKRWLEVAEELNGLAKDLRDIVKTRPAPNRLAGRLDADSVASNVKGLLGTTASNDPEPGARGTTDQTSGASGKIAGSSEMAPVPKPPRRRKKK